MDIAILIMLGAVYFSIMILISKISSVRTIYTPAPMSAFVYTEDMRQRDNYKWSIMEEEIKEKIRMDYEKFGVPLPSNLERKT